MTDSAIALLLLAIWGAIALVWFLFGLWRRPPEVPRGRCVHGVLLTEPCRTCIAVMSGKHVQLDGEPRPPPGALRDTLNGDTPVEPQAAVPVTQDPISGFVEVLTPDEQPPPRGAA